MEKACSRVPFGIYLIYNEIIVLQIKRGETMLDWLILAEKSSQGQDIASAIFDLGRPSGSLTKGGLGGTNLSSRFQGTVKVARFQGHIVEMDWPERQNPKYSRKQQREVNLDDLTEEEKVLHSMGFSVGPKGQTGLLSYEELFDYYPIQLPLGSIAYTTKPKMKGLAQNVLRLFKEAKHVIIATDADAEGEMIFRNWATEYYKGPLPYHKLYRVLISSTDKKSIDKAFDETLQPYTDFQGKLGDFYASLYPRGFARGVADYEFGLSYTLYGQLLGGPTGVWGRLKNTILGHVFQAEEAHDQFKPGVRYRLDMQSENGVLIKSDLFFDTKAEGEQKIASLNLPSMYQIQGNVRERLIEPPLLYSRAELLVKANELSAKDWGPVLQRNYEQHKVLSYPRTDSRYITSLEWDGLKQWIQNPVVQEIIQRHLSKYPNETCALYLDRPLGKRWVDPSKTVPHYALIPNPMIELTSSLYQQLSEDERKLFELDLLRSMTLFYEDCRVNQLDVQFEVCEVSFKTSYKEVLDQGWRLLVDDLEKSERMPKLGEQSVQYVLTEVPNKQPPLLTEASLLKLLKRRNEGTSATRDGTIYEMLRRRGLVKEGGRLRLSPKLKPIVRSMFEKGYIEMDQTAQWQSMLDEIQTEKDAYAFIASVRDDTQSLHDKIKSEVKR